MSDDGDTRKRWILNSPYKEPSSHWILDSQGRASEQTQEGRRESAELIPVPSEQHAKEADPNIEPYKTINQFRKAVSKWRRQEYPGASLVSLDLIEHFASEDLEPRPFWCQCECFETLVWLLEAGKNLPNRNDRDEWERLYKHVQTSSVKHNEDIFRIAFKMATGTGKTKVMTMVLAWLVLVRKIQNVLVITPNLAIKNQLVGLKEQAQEIVPRKYRDATSRLRLSVMNFHKFAPRDISGLADTPGKIHKQVIGVSDDANRESIEQIVNRLLKDHDKLKKFVVINDEAHHCRFTKKKETGEDRRGRDQRMRWANAIKQIHDSNRLELVLDFSATPMYLQKQPNMESILFPWTVTDFPLLESIESGLVKIPRLPSVDHDKSGKDFARRIYENTTDNKLKCTELQDRVKKLLHTLADNHEKQAELVWRKDPIVEPVFIVVANTIENAFELYKYIAGYEDEDGWIPGQIPHFSNIREDGSGPIDTPPTVIVTSDLDEAKDGSGKTGNSMLDEQIKVHARDLQGLRNARSTFRSKLRDIYMSVGKKGEIGEHIKCVVSVSMLTEGWDCRTVTSVFGFRQFGSSLLCEQVVGRSLRRTEHTLLEDGKLTDCYADILGVPFEFMKSRETPDPRDLTHIYSIPERKDQFHLEFPCVERYENEIVQVGEIRLDPCKVKTFNVPDLNLDDIVIEGCIGKKITLIVSNDYKATTTARMRLASICTNKLISDTSNERSVADFHKREIFRQFMRVVTQWWDHENVNIVHQAVSEDISDPNEITKIAVQYIFEAVALKNFDWNTTIYAILDEFEPSRSTSGIDYRTGKSLCPDTSRTEINKAVCDSGSEKRLADILDSHLNVIRWARNEKIGLKIPWYDEDRLRWRKYEPDFLAQGKGPNGTLVNLVIEFKGLEDQDAITKRRYAEDYWIPSINRMIEWSKGVEWKYLYLTNDNPTHMRLAVKHSIQSSGTPPRDG